MVPPPFLEQLLRSSWQDRRRHWQQHFNTLCAQMAEEHQLLVDRAAALLNDHDTWENRDQYQDAHIAWDIERSQYVENWQYLIKSLSILETQELSALRCCPPIKDDPLPTTADHRERSRSRPRSIDVRTLTFRGTGWEVCSIDL